MTRAQGQVLVVETPMEPPEWALLQRQLLDANSQACRVLAEHALDERGYLLHVPRWGVIDGPTTPSRPLATGLFCTLWEQTIRYWRHTREPRRDTGSNMENFGR